MSGSTTRFGSGLLPCVAALTIAASSARADPVPEKTPFEGAWVPKGALGTCEETKLGAGGDGFLIEGRRIGAGDTVCTFDDMTVQKSIHYFRMNCHGLNRAFAGTKFIRIDVLDPDRILFRHQGEKSSEKQRCPK